MCKILFLFFGSLLVNFSGFTQNDLINQNSWQFEKIILNGQEVTNNGSYYHSINFQNFQDNILLTSGYCDIMFGIVAELDSVNNTFSYNAHYEYILDCDLNAGDLDFLTTINNFYLNQGELFSYTFNTVDTGTQLLISNSLNNVAVYNNFNLNTDSFVKKIDMLIYPNPVQDNLYYDCEHEVVSVSIYSIDGKLIDKIEYNNINNKHIDLSFLKSGLYLIEFYFEDSSKLTKKIIKN